MRVRELQRPQGRLNGVTVQSARMRRLVRSADQAVNSASASCRQRHNCDVPAVRVYAQFVRITAGAAAGTYSHTYQQITAGATCRVTETSDGSNQSDIPGPNNGNSDVFAHSADVLFLIVEDN